jgi:hypothetical protein
LEGVEGVDIKIATLALNDPRIIGSNQPLMGLLAWTVQQAVTVSNMPLEQLPLDLLLDVNLHGRATGDGRI